jgi:acetyltransferase-like isoleucine patch superfamily enzyme
MFEVTMIVNTGYEIGENSNVREGSIIYPHVKIGDNFQSGHYCVIREHTTIGNNCSVGTHTEIGAHVKIGNNVRIHSNCFVPEYTEIADDVWIGPCVCITNTLHPLCSNAKGCLKRTRVIIKKLAIIGANVTILPNVVIAKGSIIGAGSLVNKSTRDNVVYYGHPAEEKCMRNILSCHFDGFFDNHPNKFHPYDARWSIPPPLEIQNKIETVSECCRKTGFQQCHICENISCCDNTNEELRNSK